MARAPVPAPRGGSQLALFDEVPPPKPSSRQMGFRGSLTVGLLLIAVFIGGFGSWAALAPLESAAIALGEIIVEGNRRSVEHLEGGIVKEIRVKDGSSVNAGDPLIILDDTQARASMQLLRKRLNDNAALAARLDAERQEASDIAFPAWLLEKAKTDPEVAAIIATQENIFFSRAATIESQLSMLSRRSAQFREEKVGLQAEIDAIDQELVHIRDELADVRKLVDEGLTRRERLYSLQRQEASILGRRGRNTAALARADQSISENELRVERLDEPFMSQPFEFVYRTERSIPEVGHIYRCGLFEARVDGVSESGVTAFVLRLNDDEAGRLDEPGVGLLRWNGEALVRVPMPAVGEVLELERPPEPFVGAP